MTNAALAARTLLDARHTGKLIAGLSAAIDPVTREDAYRIQDELIAGIAPVGGWKIMGVDSGDMSASPLPSTFFHEDGASIAASGLPVVIAEVEIAVRLGSTLGARPAPYTADDMRSAIASLHPAIELISLSWSDKDKVGKLTQLADFQNSAGLVTGPAVADWQKFDTATAGVELRLDGKVAASANTGASLPQILEGMAWLANHAVARGVPLAAGQVVTTGARILAPTNGSRKIDGDVAGLGHVTATLA